VTGQQASAESSRCHFHQAVYLLLDSMGFDDRLGVMASVFFVGNVNDEGPLQSVLQGSMHLTCV
jgi:hypothetical protein